LGLGAGLAEALLWTRLMGSLLFDVSAAGAVTFSAAALRDE